MSCSQDFPAPRLMSFYVISKHSFREVEWENGVLNSNVILSKPTRNIVKDSYNMYRLTSIVFIMEYATNKNA